MAFHKLNPWVFFSSLSSSFSTTSSVLLKINLSNTLLCFILQMCQNEKNWQLQNFLFWGVKRREGGKSCSNEGFWKLSAFAVVSRNCQELVDVLFTNRPCTTTIYKKANNIIMRKWNATKRSLQQQSWIEACKIGNGLSSLLDGDGIVKLAWNIRDGLKLCFQPWWVLRNLQASK